MFLFIQNAFSQPYVEGGKTRHRFAQLNVGLDFRYFPSSGTSTYEVSNSGVLVSKKLLPQHQSSIVIGGTHFWGNADFFIAIPYLSRSKSGFKPNVETSLRYFPKRIEHNKIRPFIAASWIPSSFTQGDGSKRIKHHLPLATGIVYNRKNLLVELTAAYDFNNRGMYFISPIREVEIRTQPLRISFGIKWMLETTVSAEKDWQNGRTKHLTDTLAKLGMLNSLTVGIGPSAALFIKESSHNADLYPYMGQPKIANTFPELSVGYYLHNADVQSSLVYRNIIWKQDGFSHRQTVIRKALTLESYKLFADYHGFVPFIGLGVSREWLEIKERLPTLEERSFKQNLYRPSLVFGWDIRPNRLQVFYLRTVLRWCPSLVVATYSGKQFSIDQMEFNFIQCVVLLDRLF